MRLYRIQHDQAAGWFAGKAFQFVGNIGIEMDRFSGLEFSHLGSQSELQIALHDIDELFAIVFVGHGFVRLMGFLW